MEHPDDSINLLQFLLRDVQPEVEGLGELCSDLLARGGRYVRVRFEKDLHIMFYRSIEMHAQVTRVKFPYGFIRF